MGNPSVSERVKTIVAKKLDRAVVKDESNFTQDLGADSLDKIELIMNFEDEFDLEIADDDGDRMKTVGDAIDYIKKKVT